MSYKVLPPARDDLDHIEDWVFANFGATAAIKAIDGFIDVFETLSRFPQAGPERPEIYPAPIRFFTTWPNFVMYEPGSPLLIHRVLSARMDLRDFKL